MPDLWTITEEDFQAQSQHHKETIFTIGNGYLSTRGVFEEGYPDERRTTFIHGVFDDAPIVFTELANVPDWLFFEVYLNGERFSLERGRVEHYERRLWLRNGLLSRRVRWISPGGLRATLIFERFTSLANEHTLFLRCQVIPEFEGEIEFRAALNGNMDNEGLLHWGWMGQGKLGDAVYLHNRTRHTRIDLVSAMRLSGVEGQQLERAFWDAHNTPTLVIKMAATPGERLIVDKYVAIATSRDSDDPLQAALEQVNCIPGWHEAYADHTAAWDREWEYADVQIEGDDEAQLAVRFNLYQMLIAAPLHDDRVSIGAKTLSGFGYRGHVFWDTEIFILPFFTLTAPGIARNLLNYRYQRLPAARRKARANGYEGAQFPWESADSGEEVTPTWVPHGRDRTQLIRIWTGDIEIHISADIAYAAYQYWRISGDDAWFIEKGAELILDTAKFWASRAEWNAEKGYYEYNDVIGPDEYHEHVNNNAYTNRMAQWNLQTALSVLDWLKTHAPQKAAELMHALDLSPSRLAHWQEVAQRIYLPIQANGLIEQFEGYFLRRDVDLRSLEPRTQSAQAILGIEGCNQTQILKQPDVLMLLYLLREQYPQEQICINHDYYTPRTDHSYGSSLGPAIQAIMACEIGRIDEAYEHFLRAIRADLYDVRGNARDGIHAASAGGTWQALVFGFGGLRFHSEGWELHPRLPKDWKRLAFRFFYRGQPQECIIQNP